MKADGDDDGEVVLMADLAPPLPPRTPSPPNAPGQLLLLLEEHRLQHGPLLQQLVQL